MRRNKKNIISGVLGLLLLVTTSCQKQQIKCKGNCATVSFAGRVFDKTTNQPLRNQRISITYIKNRCFLCTSIQFSSGKSGNDGRFNIPAKIDTTLFHTHHFNVAVQTPENYIQYPEPVGPGISHERGYANAVFYKLNPDSMSRLSFPFFPSTLLKIRMQRLTPIYAPNPHIGLNFTFDNKTAIWGLMESSTNADTTLTIFTSSNIYTKISASKYTSPSNIVVKTDSILCINGQPNQITITY